MSPPLPPLPPSGPASGLNFSRRTDTHPLPPLPARRCNVTRSTNVAMVLPTVSQTADGRAEARPSEEKLLAVEAQAPAATMLTTLRPPLVPNSTAPAERANRVSSPPRPTFTPGWKCVPRWRTRISPALTVWPPKRFTPRRCALESRPLRVELAPFLCAMSVQSCCSCRVLLDAGDLDAGELRAVALALLVAGLVLELLDDDLGSAQVADDL